MNCNSEGKYHDFHKITGICKDCGIHAVHMAPEIPSSRILDEFGFPIPTTPMASISAEDLELTKRFLKDAQDKTLSRSTHRVLGDLLGRLP